MSENKNISVEANPQNIANGDIVCHFKKETYDGDDKNMYMYKVLAMDAHTTDDYSRVVVYQALYSSGDVNYGTYIRYYDEFLSEVDHDKYPDIKQKYRFEKQQANI